MILKSKDIQQPTEEQIAEMKNWSSDGVYRMLADKKGEGNFIVYVDEDPAYLICVISAEAATEDSSSTESQLSELQYYYYFGDKESSYGFTVPKGKWIYYSINKEFTTYSEQLGSIYYDETDAEVYSESYFSALGRVVEENELFLNTQKTMALKTKGKYCDSDIKILPLLQKKVVTSNSFITPDEGFSGLDAVLVEINKGIYPTGAITLTENKRLHKVREYEKAYVDVDPEDLELCDTTIRFNGTYTPPADKNGFYSVTVDVQAGTQPTSQEKTIDTNGEHYPDEGNDCFSKVIVNVQPPLEDIEITENGTYNASSGYEGLGEVTVNVPEPTAGNGKYLARCVDYDGRILKQQYLNTGDKFEVPISSVEQKVKENGNRLDYMSNLYDTYIKKSDITLMPSYRLKCNTTYPAYDEYSEFDITLNKNTGKTVNLTTATRILRPDDGTYYLAYCMGNIDWGDGTTVSKAFDISISDVASHTYSDYGDYTIRIESITRIPGYFFGQDEDTPNTFCKRVFLRRHLISEICENAFRNCTSLTEVNIPSIKNLILGAHAFDGCKALTSIIIPGTVTTISDYAFNNCYSLSSVYMRSNLITTIGVCAFSNCYSLNSITLPDSLTSIGASAFRNTPLKNVFIPGSVTTIGGGAFYGASNTTGIYDFSEHTSVPTILNSRVFGSYINIYVSDNRPFKIIVPDDLYDEWINTEGYWSEHYSEHIYKVSEVTE